MICDSELSYCCSGDGTTEEAWLRGSVLATAQNFARTLMEMPSNHMTPTDFVRTVSHELGTVANKDKIEIIARYWLDGFSSNLFPSPILDPSLGLRNREWVLSCLWPKGQFRHHGC